MERLEIRFEEQQYSASDNPLNLAHKLQTPTPLKDEYFVKLYQGEEYFLILRYQLFQHQASKLHSEADVR